MTAGDRPADADEAAPPDDGTAHLAGLLAETGQGDRAAFREVYALTSSKIFGVVLFILRDRGMAEEVAQEVYVSVWRRAASYDPDRGNPLGWMTVIARNRAIDRLRAERARGFVSYADRLPEPESEHSDPVGLTIDSLALRTGLSEMKPEYRKALMLTYFNGYSNSELAAFLKVPVGTAKTWVRRGLIALREALE